MNLDELTREIKRALHNNATLNGEASSSDQASQAVRFENELAERLAYAINAYVQSEITRRFAQLPVNLICSTPGAPVTPSPAYNFSVVQ